MPYWPRLVSMVLLAGSTTGDARIDHHECVECRPTHARFLADRRVCPATSMKLLN